MGAPVVGKSTASFRDPSGFVFEREGVLFRQVNRAYESDYDLLVGSGLIATLVGHGQLVAHDEVPVDLALTEEAIHVLRPERIPLITYPYEWSFGMLKSAALLTLDIQREAMDKGLSLKDASAYNVQFIGTRPVFIDTLSFEALPDGQPWIAYRQFCRHFLAPLALMAKVDYRLGSLLQTHLDGIPLDLAARLLPATTRLKPGLAMHIHLHARSEKVSEQEQVKSGKVSMGKTALMALVDNLKSTVESLNWEPTGTEWVDYYSKTNYSDQATANKRGLVDEFLGFVSPSARTVWDLGANTGAFSALAARREAYVIAWDFDAAAVEAHYQSLVRSNEERVLPLVLDLSNPSPSLGWAHAERSSFLERGPADVVLALALIHHLAIGNNVPLPQIASLFARIGPWAIVEFVPKEDSQVQRLLRSREDVFEHYTQSGFESAFGEHFEIARQASIGDSLRTLYLLRRRA